MSVSYLPTAAPVDLFNEADFRLGAFQARPGVREIQLDRHVERLEPRVFQVLIVLARSRNRTISRDALIALCWDGRFVSDDALNRTIGRLRQVFARDPSGSVTIETVPRLGYQLRVHEPDGEIDADAVIAPRGAERARTPQSAHRPYWAIGLFALLLAALAGGAAAYLQVGARPADPEVGIRAITTDIGVEAHPALAPSGSMIVYTAAASMDDTMHLYLRTIDGPVEQLTSGDASDTAPTWSPDGQRIAFVRNSPARGCQIMIMALPRGEARTVAPCSLPRGASLTWLDDQTLLVSDRPVPAAPLTLFRVDVGTGARRQITNPPSGTVGDQMPAVSPDGRRIAFRRTSIPGVSEVFVANPDGGDARQFTRDQATVLGVAWAADGRHMYVSTTRGGDFGLWRYDAARADHPERMVTGLRRIGRLSADRDGRVAFEAFDVRSEIVRVTGDTQAPPTASSGESAYPHLSPDGQSLLFSSDRSGEPAIWLMSVGAGSSPPARLISRDYDYVAWPRWSPSGRQIAFIATTGSRSQLNVAAADGGRIRTAFETADTLWSPQWMSEDTVVLAINRSGIWRLWKIRVTDGQAAPVSPPGWDSVRVGPDGRLYGTQFAVDGVWRVPANGAGTATFVAPLSSIEWRNWEIDGNEVITVRRTGTGVDLVATPLSGGAARVVGKPAGVAGLSGVTGDAARGFYVTRGETNESDIVLLDTVRRRN